MWLHLIHAMVYICNSYYNNNILYSTEYWAMPYRFRNTLSYYYYYHYIWTHTGEYNCYRQYIIFDMILDATRICCGAGLVYDRFHPLVGVHSHGNGSREVSDYVYYVDNKILYMLCRVRININIPTRACRIVSFFTYHQREEVPERFTNRYLHIQQFYVGK